MKTGKEECIKRVNEDLYMRPARFFRFISDLEKNNPVY